MRSFIAATALSALLVSAQNTSFTIDPNEVPATQRAQWCSAQTSTCNVLCDSNPQDNSCAVENLQFSCTCQNGTAPGLQYYLQTIDTFVCQQAFQDCISANVGDSTGQKNCTTSIQDNCGTLDPAKYTAAPTGAESSAPPSDSTPTPTGNPSSPASPTGPSSVTSQAAAPDSFQHLGTGVLAAGMGVLAYLL